MEGLSSDCILASDHLWPQADCAAAVMIACLFASVIKPCFTKLLELVVTEDT